MNIIVTGASGLIGTALVARLEADAHEVTRLTSSAPQGAKEIQWYPNDPLREIPLPEGTEAVVHLTGESVAGRWTEAKKDEIRSSRVEVTRRLSERLAALPQPPRVLLSASAIGYYGDRENTQLTEDSAPGEGFLAEVCRDWEAATEPATAAGIRVVTLRFGIVLSQWGGALPRMLLPFRLGLGGMMGDGQQFWSWISIDDTVGAILHALKTDDLTGPLNIVSPHPVTNRQMARTLGKVLRRPAILPIPAVVLELLLGEMAGESLLASARVEPEKLKAAGYPFRHPDLEEALRYLLS